MPRFAVCEPISERELDSLNLPILIRNKELMGPGVWNQTNYTPQEINDAFDRTDWEDKDILSLFLDHKDRETTYWVGWVKNPRKGVDGKVIGDLEIWDENIARKLVQAKAKFGISPKLRGIESGGSLKNFVFENFSVVTKPACKTAYINLIQKEEGGENMKEVKFLEEEEKEEPENKKKPNDDSKKEAPKQPQPPAPAEKPEEKKKKPEEEEMSADEMLSVTTHPQWGEFVAKMQKKDPKMTLSQMAREFKKTTEECAELEQMSDSDIMKKVSELMAIVSKRSQESLEQKETPEQKEIKSLRQEIRQLSEKVSEPASKTLDIKQDHKSGVKELSMVPEEQKVSPVIEGFADYLINDILGGDI